MRELSAVAKEFGISLITPRELEKERALAPAPDVDEHADSYRGNAMLKAEAFFAWSGMPSIADDSGLEVEALGGRPGIHSARYAGPGKTDAERCQKLIAELDSLGTTASRRALFRCVLVCKMSANEVCESEGVLTGKVLEQPRGERGFGYDPILLIDALGKTLAEIDFETLVQHGFRPQAARALFAKLAKREDR